MALDFAQVVPQLQRLLPTIRDTQQERDDAQKEVWRRLQGEKFPWEALSARLEERRSLLSFVVPAELMEDPKAVYQLPAAPDYCVVATDGSQIELDRHSPVPCYLINLGQVVLQYGKKPRARLSGQPRVFLRAAPGYAEESTDEEVALQMEHGYIGLERQVAEMRGLSQLVAAEETHDFTLALLDGSLILWTAWATPYPQHLRDYIRTYAQQYADSLEEIHQLAGRRPLTVASYISFPGSREVANALRVLFCHEDRSLCEATCRDGKPTSRPCDIVEGLVDRDLFLSLREGERSALFASRNGLMERYAKEREVCFFYLNAGPEIARVEVPAWVAQDKKLLDLTHAAVYDQCRRNFGYPVALMEAHQQAVVTEADRQAFWRLVYQTLEGERLPAVDSVKSRSKRVPWS